MPRSRHSSSDAVSLAWSPDGTRIAAAPQSRRCPGLGGHLRETDPRPPGPGGRGRGLGSRRKPRGQHHRPGDPLLGHGNLGVFREGPAHRLPHRPDVMSSPVFTRRLPHSLPEGFHPPAHVGRSRTPGCRAPRGSSQLVRVWAVTNRGGTSSANHTLSLPL